MGVTVEFRIAEDRPGQGFTECDDPDATGGVSIYLRPEVLLSDAHMEGLRVKRPAAHDGPPGVSRVLLHLTEEGSAILHRITKENVRRRLAIVVNGAVVCAPRVMEPIRGPAFAITGRDMDRLVAVLTGEPLPEGSPRREEEALPAEPESVEGTGP
ncbi:MAG: SecDF P1 head subdomain-containing protein [Planctomycetota bacterium]|jgi:preprotein translocase subunit SecD